nr:NADH dehydrogenase 3 [Asterozoa]
IIYTNNIFNFLTLFVSILIFLITTLITFAAHFLPSRNTDSEKSSPYECGFDPLNSARVPFSFRFFLVAILFLLFDLEIALLFPLPFSVFFHPIHTPLILTVGLIFEWVQGGLDWAE